ncbi:phospholipid N-methyltransferase [Streptosporangium becharense]|uniref:Phospholipid N-methyltransferase n=1 Tax=Streptosporangium becharense TaxID=1816182 RepID=A0A7W9ICF2_9ACTN|nr:methyltransferase domain-containing protein [Streptosporangium becharense]MBB2915457.1 phospholipid N-methyltransferase [Streptosporangium becharense]MBB5817644.1 phospholipid N-methyltransferase [Streptosporangium becharense]
MTNDTALFLRQWIRSPGTVGAVAPSSRRLAEEVASPIPHRGDPVIVELGPGTGAFTAEIQRRLGGRGHHMAVEINPELAGFLAARNPGVDVVVGDAAKLPELLRERGLERADAVVSGLPWAAFSDETQTRLLDAVTAIMGPHTAFTTFAYSFAKRLPPARRFRSRLLSTFEEVVVGRTVWGNLPPAFVYHARRPRGGSGAGTD